MKYFIKKLKILFLILSGLTFLNPHKSTAKEMNMSDKKILIAYFSKTGEQYSVGNITEGNTAIIAKMISQKTQGDLFEIELENDTYPKEYHTLTEAALKEKKENARPKLKNDVSNFDDYDIVFLGSPNWWADMPMVLYTFIEAHNWSGKTVVPFVTHEGSGLSSIANKIKDATNTDILEGLAVYGHTAQNNRDQAQEEVTNWLKKIGF